MTKLYCKISNSSKLILKIPEKTELRKINNKVNKINLYIRWIELG